MRTPRSIFEGLKPLSTVEGYDAAERFLCDPTTRMIDHGTDGRVTVEMIDHAWGTRLQIARKNGRKPVTGSEHLVSSLAKLPKTTILKMVVLEGPTVGCAWFLEETGEPIGFIIGETAAL